MATDKELLLSIINRLDNIPLKANQTCSDVVVEHSKILTSVSDGITYVKETINKLDEKMDEVVKDSREYSTRLTKLETEKKTAIAVIMAIGSVLLSVFQMFHK